MDLNGSSLDIIEDGSPHRLLEPPSPAYSNVTVRRAFIVWMYCGQTNKFKDVCNYYHYLEALEDKLPFEQRAASRHHEFNMFTNPPPTSSYLLSHYPKLYSYSPIEPYYVQKLEAIKNEKCVFKLEGFSEIKQKGVTTAEIIETSQIIRQYCNHHQITLRKLLEEYRKYATKCGLSDTVTNIASYIKRKMVEADLKAFAHCPLSLDFLNSTINSEESFDSDDGIIVEVEKPEETIRLKQILGVNNDSDKENEKADEKKYNSCNEFFKSFNSNPQNLRINSYSPLTPKIEDFVKLFDQNRQKSSSLESLIQGKPNIVGSLSFANQDYFDTSLGKTDESNKLRKI